MVRKPKWDCVSVDRVFHEIQTTEMRQRLAETLEILLSNKGQLQNQVVPAFSKDSNLSLKSELRFNKRRRSA